MLERPVTTAEFFDKICEILKEQGQMPDILDYYTKESHPVPITTYSFNIANDLEYGGNEGIYLDIYVELHADGGLKRYNAGTFKTLEHSPDAMRTMGLLLADFIVEATRYVDANLNDFTWEGADVYPVGADGNRVNWSYTCSSMDRAIARKDMLLEKYDKVIIRDNASRKEVTYRK